MRLGSRIPVTSIAVVGAAAATMLAAFIVPVGAVATTRATATTATDSPWTETGGNAANSRANLAEKVLTASNAAKIVALRSYTAPANPPSGAGACRSVTPPAPMTWSSRTARC